MLTAGRIARAFPASAGRAAVTIAAALTQSGLPPLGPSSRPTPDAGPTSVTGERVDILYRIYNPELVAELADALPAIERDVLACLYTRRQGWT